MPCIVLPNSKGGSGKTTSAFILATELAYRGFKVTAIDSDPNHPLVKWEKDGGKAERLTIVENGSEKTIIANIENAIKSSNFVIVDLEGTANLAVAYAISLADLVIIPTQRSNLDAEEAAKTVTLVLDQSKVSRRQIPVAILLTRTSPAIRPKALNRMLTNMESRKLHAFTTEIHEREAFKAIFDHARTLNQLSEAQVSSLPNARANSAEFAAEVLLMLQSITSREKSVSEEEVA